MFSGVIPLFGAYQISTTCTLVSLPLLVSSLSELYCQLLWIQYSYHLEEEIWIY